ncbi:non-structural maintenance of chromosomes element [Canna indica]|uniref:Non-structural maintenance of chromosomes element 4 n=1 Tax=Canna indica TaxID=4628 RepID=A0AAQ3KNA0_9LILI|nr:non-structural maintenance of chromosomes element [Canna indica]
MAGTAMKGETVTEAGEGSRSPSRPDCAVDRRALRSRYLAVMNLLSDDKDGTGSFDSDKFRSFFAEVENLHDSVQKPREQVADAEALLGITNSLFTLVKSQRNGQISPSEFVNALMRKFMQKAIGSNSDYSHSMFAWKDIGLVVSRMFGKDPKCHTMMGPMDNTLKQRRTVVHRKRKRPTKICYPEELSQTEPEGKNDTEKNMFTMFSILRKKRSVRFEFLVLNRLSFAQTVENIFALSFLVKDGRAEINANDDGRHLVSPRNAPPATPDNLGVTYHHYIFRFDFKDWKLMLDLVPPGEELMPHRSPSTCFTSLDEPVQGLPVELAFCTS